MTIDAYILVPPFHRYYFDLSINGWKVIPTSGGTRYTKDFNDNTTSDEYLSSLEDLQIILVACFIEDFSPRKVFGFSFENENRNEILNAITVFGSSISQQPTTEELAQQSFNISGELFGPPLSDPHYIPDLSLIKEWFVILKENRYLFIALQTLMNSFITFNNYFNSSGYFDRSKLLDGITLLISSLESIFLHGQDDHSDITFKFSLIGSIYYERFVTDEMIKKFGEQYKKFSYIDFKSILKELYRIRSHIAHGQYDSLMRAKNWRKFLDQKSVYYEESFKENHLFKSVSLALCLFEKHIFSLIKASKKNLLNGINIIDQI